MKKVFLGGTCNESTWRNDLIPLLHVDYFNPVVLDWTEEHQQRELHERENCDILLYTITPSMSGVYSIAEVTDDSNKHPERTIFCLLTVSDWKSFDESQIRSLHAVGKLVERNGGKYFTELVDVANYINSL